MHYTPITPFRRTASAVHMPAPCANPDVESIDKWEALRNLATARTAFGLSDRDLSVLEVLLSFYPERILRADDLIVVHPSNATICARLNGMPSSTMRRHLARLVETGVVIRRDSPNGKRFARMSDAGKTVFGIDLSPLVTRQAVIKDEADRLTAEAEAIRQQRETLSLMRRDLAHLAAFGAMQHPEDDWSTAQTLAQDAAKMLRRVLSLDLLEALHDDLAVALEQLRQRLTAHEAVVTEETGIPAAQNERHLQTSNIKYFDIETAGETETKPLTETALAENKIAAPNSANNAVPLQMVLMACREIQSLSPAPIRNWSDLTQAAEQMRPMMGIGTDLWRQAQQIFGGQMAAVVLAAMLERFHAIRSGGAYLRHLTRKMLEGRFSVTPMVMALLHPARYSESSQL